MKEKPSRKVYLDYLRVYALFAVMILHASTQNWYKTDVNGLQWQTFNFYDSITRWCVPVFVMISGTLFLNRAVSVKKLYSKYILRLAASFAVWSVIYALYAEGTTLDRIGEAILGHFHMWFILMMTGVYMCIPLVRPIVQNEKRIRYYLFLSFIFAFAFPEIVTLAHDFGNKLIIAGVDALNDDVARMSMDMVLGYVAYFVLGYYLDRITLSKKQRRIIYILGLIGAVFTVGMDLLVALRTQSPCKNYYEFLSVNVLLESAAVFTFFKYRKYDSPEMDDLMRKLSKCVFGAYLVHILVIDMLDRLTGIDTLVCNPIISVFCIAFFAFVVSLGISSLLNRIPGVNKYLV